MTVDEVQNKSRRLPRAARLGLWVLGIVVAAAIVSAVFDLPGFTALGALALGAIVFRAGWFFLQSMATPPPPPPEPGTLRKVKLTYRCDVCGAEVRMTAAATEEPEPPRHCMDEMTLVTPLD